VSNLIYPEMSEEAQEVQRTLAFSGKQVAATDESWFSVCIMPYRTKEDVIAGVVITFSNITEFKKLVAGYARKMRDSRVQLRLEVSNGNQQKQGAVTNKL
jgi:PAS domain